MSFRTALYLLAKAIDNYVTVKKGEMSRRVEGKAQDRAFSGLFK